MSKSTVSAKSYLMASIVMLLATSFSHAEFTMNFNNDPAAVNYGLVPNAYMQCTAGWCDESGTGGFRYQYRGGIFFTEIVQATGAYYWHTVLDQRATNGFAQETFIKAVTSLCPPGVGYLPCPQDGTGPFTNRNDGYYSSFLASCANIAGCNPPQTGYPNGATDGSTVPNTSLYWNSIVSPIDNSPGTTGIGTGNPQSVQIRQLLTGAAGTWSQEYNKSLFANKPRITQTSTAADLQSRFDIDMTALDYNTSTTPGTVTYTLQLAGASLPGSLGDFNYATDKGASFVTGGRYVYAAGPGYGGAGGTYTYVDGNFNPNNIKWKQIYDPLQNELYSWSSYYQKVILPGSPTAYALIDSGGGVMHWLANQLYPGSNQDCNSTNLTCPSWQGWK